MPKKTETAKKKTQQAKKRGPGRPPGSKNKTSTPAKRGPGRPPGSKNKSTPAKKTAAKKTAPAKKKTTNVKKPADMRGKYQREFNEETGFVLGSDQDLVAQALLEGGSSQTGIVHDMEKVLDTETRNGTPKQISNIVSSVINKMVERGYIVESSFQLLPPTPASKRKATAARNAKAKSSSGKSKTTKKRATGQTRRR